MKIGARVIAAFVIVDLVIAAAVVMFIVLGGGDGSDGGDRPAAARTTPGTVDRPEESQVGEIVVRDGAPVGGVQELDFFKGESIRLRVTSDVEDEVHVHGYEISKPVRAGRSVSFDFVASIEGVFEIELEGRRQQLAELTVLP